MVRLLNSPKARSPAGFTLVELMVSLAVLAVVLSGLAAGAIGIYRTSHVIDLGTTDQNEARTAISVLSRDIRAAAPVRATTEPAFLVAQPNAAVFTANLDSSTLPRLVRFQIDPDRRLIEDATPPDPASDPEAGLDWDVENDAVVRFIAAFVVNEPSLPLFRYFDANGDELVYSGTACTGPDGEDVAAPCLTDSARREVAIVELSLTVSSDPGDRVRRFTVSQRVRLPNAS